MKKIGRFFENIALIKNHCITFQSGLFNNASFTRKAYILNMVGSKQLNNKLKATPKDSLRTQQVAAATSTTQATEESNEDLIETTRKIVREELGDHKENVSEIIKSQLTNTDERLEKVSQEVADITKSLEFTQEELHDLLDPIFVMEKLTDLEYRSRWNNVRIDSIPETSNETLESCEEKVRNIIKNQISLMISK